ncbi:unnamed protein product [Calicophoron daubneyi]|uniref:RNB domain-containing protein n=1 Tax=Calicophoron daubneyi TaxID=300641 RepID=A0AAV2TBQ3_CALDB
MAFRYMKEMVRCRSCRLFRCWSPLSSWQGTAFCAGWSTPRRYLNCTNNELAFQPKRIPFHHRHEKLASPISTEEALRLIEEGSLIQGQLQILSHSLAFVEHPSDRSKVFIIGTHRLQALHQDIVAVRILPMGQWRVKGTCRQSREPSEDAPNETPPNSVVEDVVEDRSPLPDANLGSEFVDVPGIKPSIPDASRTKPSSLYDNKTLLDLCLESSSNWPADLRSDLDLVNLPQALSPLPNPKLIRVGQVVSILKKSPRSRRLLGQVAFFPSRRGYITRKTAPLAPGEPTDNAVCLFVPNSPSYPLVKLDATKLPKAVKENQALGRSANYVCAITGWNNTRNIPHGVLSEQLGDMNELESATQRILIEFGLEDREFLPEHFVGLPSSPEKFTIPTIEYLRRRDFRSCCIFTIDPPSAKDIDDALHVKRLGYDLYEVGIHIADVTYFVHPGTALDQEAANRTTSIYLVQRVIPMLPAILSEHLCSLKPCADRLAFSVVLKVKSSGEVVDSWIGRSIIRSRVQLSYDQALTLLNLTVNKPEDPEKLQRFIDVVPKPELPFTFDQLQDAISILNKIAENLRKSRIENGALALQKTEIEFDLPCSSFNSNSDLSEPKLSSSPADRTVWPLGYSLQDAGPSHKLIEEWMLAANQAVARRLFDEFWQHIHRERPLVLDDGQPVSDDNQKWPGILLRRHSPPSPSDMEDLRRLFGAGGIELKGTTSKDLTDALNEHNKRLEEEGRTDEERKNIMDALSYLVYIRMKMATYFSLDDFVRTHPDLLADTTITQGSQRLLDHTWHFGLNVPLYTHFTSPIRRYADMLVHRALNYVLSKGGRSDTMHGKFTSQLNRPRGKTLVPIRRGRSPQLPQNPIKSAISRLAVQANWCNSKRMMTRRAQEASDRLFLTACLKDCGPVIVNATVLDFDKYDIQLFVPGLALLTKYPLKQFFRLTDTWKVVKSRAPTSAPSENEAELPEKCTGRTPSCLMLTWTPSKGEDTDVEGTAEQATITEKINVLSSVPCRIFCQPDSLVLGAEFLPAGVSDSKQSSPPCDPDGNGRTCL